MLVDVTPLRTRGMRLRNAELPEPIRGLLQTSWITQSVMGYPIMTASLMERQGVASQRSLITMLDARLVAITDGALVLEGIELEQADGRMWEHRQVWRCVPVRG